MNASLYILAAITVSIVVIAWIVVDFLFHAAEQYKEGFQKSAASRLESMFVFLDPTRLFILNLAAMVLLALVLWVMTEIWMLAALGPVLMIFSPQWIWKWLHQRRLKQIEAQLPDSLMSLSGGLKAGVSLTTALQQLVQEVPAPISLEFGLLLRQQRLGLTMDECLGNLSRRVPTQNMTLVISAMRISIQTGGGLAETLERAANTVRSKLAVEGKIDALTAQGKLQMIVVGMLPIGLFLVLKRLEPEAMELLWTSAVGWATLSIVGVLEFLGIWLIRKICRIDV